MELSINMQKYLKIKVLLLRNNYTVTWNNFERLKEINKNK